MEKIKNDHPECIVEVELQEITEGKVTDSSTRFGYYLLRAEEEGILEQYLPVFTEE